MVDWTEVLIAGVGILFTAIIIPLVKAAFEWLKGKTQNEAIKAAISEAQTVADQVVLGLQQTVVDAMKAAHEDGKLTEEEVKEIGVLAYTQLLNDLSDKSIATLDANIGSIETYIKNLIESRLALLKKTA